VTHDELVAYCLAKPGAVADEPWEGSPVAKVGGKVFAFLGRGGLGVKCGRDADEAAELRHRFPDSVSVSAHIGRFGWNRVELHGAVDEGMDDDELRELVDASYDAVVAKLPARLRPAL
jgi:predicted DNA-binding protein (MmcQ/YjbR family)